MAHGARLRVRPHSVTPAPRASSPFCRWDSVGSALDGGRWVCCVRPAAECRAERPWCGAVPLPAVCARASVPAVSPSPPATHHQPQHSPARNAQRGCLAAAHCGVRGTQDASLICASTTRHGSHERLSRHQTLPTRARVHLWILRARGSACNPHCELRLVPLSIRCRRSERRAMCPRCLISLPSRTADSLDTSSKCVVRACPHWTVCVSSRIGWRGFRSCRCDGNWSKTPTKRLRVCWLSASSLNSAR